MDEFTVSELIEELKKYPKDMVVHVFAGVEGGDYNSTYLRIYEYGGELRIYASCWWRQWSKG